MLKKKRILDFIWVAAWSFTPNVTMLASFWMESIRAAAVTSTNAEDVNYLQIIGSYRASQIITERITPTKITIPIIASRHPASSLDAELS